MQWWCFEVRFFVDWLQTKPGVADWQQPDYPKQSLNSSWQACLQKQFSIKLCSRTLPKHYPNLSQTLPKTTPTEKLAKAKAVQNQCKVVQNITQILPKHYPTFTQTLPKTTPPEKLAKAAQFKVEQNITAIGLLQDTKLCLNSLMIWEIMECL